MPRMKKTDAEIAETVETVETETETDSPAAGFDISPTGLLTPGESVEIIADIFPGKIDPLPAVFSRGLAKMRLVVTSKSLTIAWPAGFKGGKPLIARYDIPIVDGGEDAGYMHGQVLAADGTVYEFGRGNGCSCGAAGLKTWNPFPGVVLNQRAKTVSTGGRAARYTRN